MEVAIRDQLMISKAQAIQQELEAWANEHGILGPGERIVFTMQIENFATVVQNSAAQYWDLNPLKFFSFDRIEGFDIPHAQAVRIANAILNELSYRNREQNESRIETMRDFLDNYSLSKLLRFPNFGKKSLRSMVRMMRASGFPLDGPKWNAVWLPPNDQKRGGTDVE